MTRKRLSLALVESKSARKTTFKNRTQCLMKKMDELTTMCDINGCIVIFNPEEGEPHVWPSKEKAVELFNKYESMPKINQDTKKVDHVKFMADRVEKLRENIAKQEKKNKEARASLIMYEMSQGKRMEELSKPEAELLLWYSKVKLEEIRRRNLLLPPIKPPNQVSSPPPPQPPPPSSGPLPCRDQQPYNQGLFVSGGGAQDGGNNLHFEPPFADAENNPLFWDMFTIGGDSADENGLWQGDYSNGNQNNKSDCP